MPVSPDEAEGKVSLPPSAAMIQGGARFQAVQIKGWKEDHPSDEGIKSGELFVYVWGAVFYRDGISNETRTTRFCHRYNCVNLKGQRIRPHFGRFHRYGNETDESDEQPRELGAG